MASSLGVRIHSGLPLLHVHLLDLLLRVLLLWVTDFRPHADHHVGKETKAWQRMFYIWKYINEENKQWNVLLYCGEKI